MEGKWNAGRSPLAEIALEIAAVEWSSALIFVRYAEMALPEAADLERFLARFPIYNPTFFQKCRKMETES
jgi:hypothetical protein